MKRKSRIRLPRNQNNLTVFLMVGILIVLLFAFSSQFFQMQNNYKKNYKNLKVELINGLFEKEFQPIKVLLNDSLIYESDSNSKNLFETSKKIKLLKGKYVLKVSTLNESIMKIDTIEIEKRYGKYSLTIYYNNSDILKKNFIESSYKKAIENHLTLDTIQKMEIKREISRKYDSLWKEKYFRIGFIDRETFIFE